MENPEGKDDAAAQVLVVEDDLASQRLIAALLGMAGLGTQAAGDGLEGWAAWRARPWDLVVLDVRMPHLDGLDLARRIRADEASSGGRRTPILAVTACAAPADHAACLAAGMDRVVTKPYAARDLLAAVEALLAPGSTLGKPSIPLK